MFIQIRMAVVVILNLILGDGGYNLGVYQNFCTKFGMVMDDKQLKVTYGHI